MAAPDVGCSSSSWSSPPEFRCPISLEPMVHPVTTADGQSYERTAIERWFAAGHRSSPVTGLPLQSTALAPNIALRGAIERYFCREREHAQDMIEMQARLATAERERQTADEKAAFSVPRADYDLLLKRVVRHFDISAFEGISDISSTSGSEFGSLMCDPHTADASQGECRDESLIVTLRKSLQTRKDLAEKLLASAVGEKGRLTQDMVTLYADGLSGLAASAACEKLRVVVQHVHVLDIQEILRSKKAKRDAIGAEISAHAEALGIDAATILHRIRVEPFAQWKGPLLSDYAQLHCDCLALSSEKRLAQQAKVVAENSAIQVEEHAVGLCARRDVISARLEGVQKEIHAISNELAEVLAAIQELGEGDRELQPSVSVADIAQAKCAASRMTGCPLLRPVRRMLIAELKRIGFTSVELHGAGFLACELKDAQLSGGELRENGYSATELWQSGFDDCDLGAVDLA
eukprot:TRINITY_DN14971_c0_g2_i1.p1 TRINITY_DN14971_c0_g2~~TRINITY_DN14971_c0_g2_i1.p1  ORF type:complete len:464 (-),score=72.61 TRINITY_DN14971_c0_g2_i1:219-1610(-)